MTEEFPASYLASVLPWQIYIQKNHVRHPFIEHGISLSTTRARLRGKAHNCAPQKRIVPPVRRQEAVSPAASASPDGQSRTDEREKSDDAKSSALRISSPDPKSGVSANFATLAFRFQISNCSSANLGSDFDVGCWTLSVGRFPQSIVHVASRAESRVALSDKPRNSRANVRPRNVRQSPRLIRRADALRPRLKDGTGADHRREARK